MIINYGLSVKINIDIKFEGDGFEKTRQATLKS